MATTIHVTPELMRSTKKNVDTHITQWNAAVSKIFNLVHQMDAMWDGLGNDTFNNVFGVDRPKFDNLNIMMVDYSKAIEVAAKLYEEAEKNVVNVVKRT